MNFLADESCAGPVVRTLREAGRQPVPQAPEARHPLAQPVRAGLKGKRMASTVGAAPNQKHICKSHLRDTCRAYGARGFIYHAPSAYALG